MPEYVSRDIHPCGCGKMVAWAVNQEGYKLPYEIRREVKEEADGGKSVVVSSNEFHYCYRLPGVGTFIQHSCERLPDGKPIHVRLPIPEQRVVLTYKKGEPRAHVTNGRSGKQERAYGWLNVKNGGYRVQTRFDPLGELLKMINEHPLDFDWSRGRSQTECCFCGRELVDERSVELGYGPICAAKYGMPR